MTRERFYIKLIPYFTGEQIDSLFAYDIHLAEDAHRSIETSPDDLQSATLDFFINSIRDGIIGCEDIEEVTDGFYNFGKFIIDLDNGTF